MEIDPIVGRFVEISSTAGIPYRGVVRSVRPGSDLGELFELGSHEDPVYQRLVFVSDRRAQIQELVGDESRRP